jgi:hypothetical protein
MKKKWDSVVQINVSTALEASLSPLLSPFIVYFVSTRSSCFELG